MALEGVRVGPLDPDRGEMFGQVGASSAARQLIRHHAAMHPPALVSALGRTHQKERSDALDRGELLEAVIDFYAEAGEALPDGAVIDGAAVRGEDDGRQQVVTFTWVVPVEEGGSGRSGKGFIPYDADHLPQSFALGNDAVRIAKLKEAGLPWHPEAVNREVAGIAGTGVPADIVDAGELDDALEENATLREEIESLRQQLSAQQAQSPAVPPVPAAPMTVEGGSALVPPQEPAPAADEPEEPPAGDDMGPTTYEPWPGYERENADVVRRKLREADDRDLARRVLAYEKATANRGTVVSLANQLIDRPS